MEWSQYQLNIFDFIKIKSENLAVIARAGSGKTSTLLECVNQIPKSKSIMVCAFNKAIQQELKSKVPAHVDCSTLHSIGFKTIGTKFGKLAIDDNKMYSIVSDLVGNTCKSTPSVKYEIKKTVSLAKGMLVDTVEAITKLIEQYGIETHPYPEETFAKYVIDAMTASKRQKSVIDFDDQIWFPFVHHLLPQKYDYIFVDEMQDLNFAQLILILSMRKPTSRIICFLDDRQAIYSFRGSDSSSVMDIIKKLDAKTLPLSISYRCPKKVIELAQKYVPDIESAPNAIDGIVSYLPEKEIMKNLKYGDVVISRTNAELIRLYFKALKDGKKSSILGRDIGNNLYSLVVKASTKNTSITDLISYMKRWKKTEVDKAQGDERVVMSVLDKYSCIINLCEDLQTVKELKERIKSLFEDANSFSEYEDRIIFSTVHQFKGKEADRIFMLNGTFRNNSQEEDNIRYVALTRSKSELYLVVADEGNNKKKKNQTSVEKNDKEVENDQDYFNADDEVGEIYYLPADLEDDMENDI